MEDPEPRRRGTRTDTQVWLMLLDLMWPPLFVPPSQIEGPTFPNFMPMLERIEWMHRQRESALSRLEDVIEKYPMHEELLMSPSFRLRLYRKWLLHGPHEILSGRIAVGSAGDWGRSLELPPHPTGTDLEAGRLPRTWYRKFIDTVFVNAWIRWHALASYRAMYYLWTETDEMTRNIREVLDRDDDASEYSREREARFTMHHENITHMGRLLAMMSGTDPVPHVVFDSEVMESRVRRDETEREMRRTATALARQRSVGRYDPGSMRKMTELKEDLDSRIEELTRAMIAARDADEDVIPHETVVTANLWGMLVPGSNGGLFSRATTYTRALASFADFTGTRDLQIREVRNMHDPELTPRENGPIRAFWDMKGRDYLSNFLKNPAGGPTQYDWGAYEAALNVEMLRIPTVTYDLIPGFTEIIENIWTNQVRIDTAPNAAPIVFDAPVRLRFPGQRNTYPTVRRVGYVGGLYRSSLTLRNAWLGGPDNLARTLEAVFTKKFLEQPRGDAGVSRITLENVFYGPRNQLPPIEVEYEIEGTGNLVDEVERAMVVRLDPMSIPLVHFRVLGGIHRPSETYTVTTVNQVILQSRFDDGRPRLDAPDPES